ncbi:MAG: hypothetical protein LBJ14_08150 [Desulfarculales bacterium]|jgi:hypothetical protein|nr:hypothetical protein [Desulfarculales bacterium]
MTIKTLIVKAYAKLVSQSSILKIKKFIRKNTKKSLTLLKKYKYTLCLLYSFKKSSLSHWLLSKHNTLIGLLRFCIISTLPMIFCYNLQIVSKKALLLNCKIYTVEEIQKIFTVFGLEFLNIFLKYINEILLNTLLGVIFYVIVFIPFISITNIFTPKKILIRLKITLYYFFSINFLLYTCVLIINILWICMPFNYDNLPIDLTGTGMFNTIETLNLIYFNLISAIILLLVFIFNQYIALKGFGLKYYQASIFSILGIFYYIILAGILYIW